MLLGDYSVVSLAMVVTRQRFFREHCTQLLNNDHFRRTNTLLPPRSGFLNNAFTFTPRKDQSEQPINPARKGFISGPTDARKVEDFVEERQMVDSPTPHSDAQDVGPGSEDSVSDGQEGRLTWDPDTPLEKSGDTAGSSLPLGILKLNGENTPPGLASPRSPANHGFHRERTIQIASPPRMPADYGTRQLLRARTRTVSVHNQTVPDGRNDLLRTSTLGDPIGNPFPEALDPLHTGFGGFPNPIQSVIRRLVPANAKNSLRRRISRDEGRMRVLHNSAATLDFRDEDGGSNPDKRSAKWMPEQLRGLVIGRNSRFFTEELSDDELEQVGGVEYRALRLLVWIVGGVS